jgi:hypothetical protein
MHPDKLHAMPAAQEFERAFFDDGKPVASICHGPWTLIDAGVVARRKVSSHHSIKTDLKNAGAQSMDEEVVVDDGLVTSRQREDFPRSTGRWSRNSPRADTKAAARTSRSRASARAAQCDGASAPHSSLRRRSRPHPARYV